MVTDGIYGVRERKKFKMVPRFQSEVNGRIPVLLGQAEKFGRKGNFGEKIMNYVLDVFHLNVWGSLH